MIVELPNWRILCVQNLQPLTAVLESSCVLFSSVLETCFHYCATK